MLLNGFKEGIFADLHVSLPCRVERYDSALQVVDVQPLIKDSHEGFDGERVYTDYPVIPNVPVLFPGGGGMRITFPIAAGDTVLVVFGDRSHDRWQHGTPGVNEPVDDHRHHLTDAYAIPGLHSNAAPWSGAEAGVITLGSDAGAPEFVATAQRVLTELERIATAFNTHVHTGVTTGPGSSGTTATPITGLQAPASATVKVRG